MNGEHTVVLALRDMWETIDPAPADLVERVLFTLRLQDLEFELMRLESELELTGARTGHETARTVTFTSDNLTVMITLSGPEQEPRRIDGWIVPAAPLRVELRTARGLQSTVADTDGRFAFSDTPSGPIQLVFHPTGTGSAAEDATNPGPGPLTQPVVTPAIQF